MNDSKLFLGQFVNSINIIKDNIFSAGTLTLKESVSGSEIRIQIKLGDQISTVIQGSEDAVTENIPIYE